jgi:hypothetical protein
MYLTTLVNTVLLLKSPCFLFSHYIVCIEHYYSYCTILSVAFVSLCFLLHRMPTESCSCFKNLLHDNRTDRNMQSIVNCSFTLKGYAGFSPPEHWSHQPSSTVLFMYRSIILSPHFVLLQLPLQEGLHCHPQMFCKCSHSHTPQE